VKTELDDISSHFKVYTVGGEQSVKEFVEEKTGRPYVIGSHLLPADEAGEGPAEEVRPASWRRTRNPSGAGTEARDLIGLPTDGVSHTRSDARESQQLRHLHRVHKRESQARPRHQGAGRCDAVTTSKRPTWDHTAVGTK
jgi:hypothetical protein